MALIVIGQGVAERLAEACARVDRAFAATMSSALFALQLGLPPSRTAR